MVRCTTIFQGPCSATYPSYCARIIPRVSLAARLPTFVFPSYVAAARRSLSARTNTRQRFVGPLLSVLYLHYLYQVVAPCVFKPPPKKNHDTSRFSATPPLPVRFSQRLPDPPEPKGRGHGGSSGAGAADAGGGFRGLRDLAAARVLLGRDQDENADCGGRGVPRSVGLLQEGREVRKWGAGLGASGKDGEVHIYICCASHGIFFDWSRRRWMHTGGCGVRRLRDADAKAATGIPIRHDCAA